MYVNVMFWFMFVGFVVNMMFYGASGDVGFLLLGAAAFVAGFFAMVLRPK